MKILADQNIPWVEAAFRDLGEVRLLPGRDIRARHLRDCQCLITRTVTRVDAELLAGTAVEFVGTATIGTDHLDLDYLRNAGITFSNAAGCNAESAAEYVLSGLFALSQQRDFNPLQLKAGIVGCGNVGSNLLTKLETLGIECLVCDPPLQHSGDSRYDFVSLDRILDECNFVSLHVPLQCDGNHPTFHLLDAARLQRLTDGCVLVNAARGEVVDNAALLDLLRQREDLTVFLDTWENEPRPARELLQWVALATPHIAGYSVEGRLRGTQMILDAACNHFNLESSWHMLDRLPAQQRVDCRGFAEGVGFWHELLQQHCNIERDHSALLAGAEFDEDAFAAHFDGLRRVYPDRLEYARFSLDIDSSSQPTQQLRQLGFQLREQAELPTRSVTRQP